MMMMMMMVMMMMSGGGLVSGSSHIITAPGSCYKHLVSAPGWVGWTNKKLPLELGFVFSSFQSVECVSVASYNKPDMGIAVR